MLIVLFIILFLLPITFQILAGINAIRGKVKMNLWQVCIASCIGQILISLVNLYLMAFFIEQAESRDGLPMVGVAFMSLVSSVLILLVILIQTIGYFRLLKNKKVKVYQ